MPRALSQKQRKDVAGKLAASAVRKHGEMRNRKARPPLDQLVLGIFYRVTSVRRATRALRELERAFADWNEVRVSHPAEVAASLSSASWALAGAERLVWLLRELFELHSRTDLDFLGELTPTQARSCLRRLPMVQRDLADEVLLLSLDVPVLPCSEDAARMTHRLGLTGDDRPTTKNQKRLASYFGEEQFASLHLFLCEYAARVCLPEEPACGRCPMQKNCQYAKRSG